MKSIFETEIDIPQAKLAEFYANPENNMKWMTDVERCEYLGGIPGRPGSKYRMVPKKGNMVFVVTIVSNNLPNESSAILESSNVNVAVTGKFIALSPLKTKFVSEQVFTFKGIVSKAFGLLAGGAIKKAHHKHMNSFKQAAMDIQNSDKQMIQNV
jgi:hypothetical protein